MASSSSSVSSPSVAQVTLIQLLSLPAHLHPVSPALSALHLARVRLLVSVPSSAVSDWTCYHCGALRDGVGAGKRRRKIDVIRKEKGKRIECTNCGMTFKRIKPDRNTLDTFPPARRTRRQNLSVAKDITIDSPPQEVRPRKEAPTLLSTPSLSYIPAESPNPPTYPQPDRLSPQPQKAAGSMKKKKKSGLAKLLAENKERQEAQLGSKGMWGETGWATTGESGNAL
ncbi:hypothetical protein BCR39DRAFT_586472 [Naematelia encephala]|uniref:Uncharacterized protein n=1 Tax=Naematelia encephala TaxID=71784 RepID=A0A1Y2BEZ0_9TREE|nr:hypothetical protein BCR39DRAFT_586472 [Naematelia encephala]